MSDERRVVQPNTHKYLRPLLKLIQDGKIDGSVLIKRCLRLDEAASGYHTSKDDNEDLVQILTTPE